ncbi:hypothetical protein T492DRAFT_867599 [Pavlovales sp. CCMP2436]|nr:hypothetical protein T492DRAFT_867599 [Pavlovales sp. CCMP2436]
MPSSQPLALSELYNRHMHTRCSECCTAGGAAVEQATTSATATCGRGLGAFVLLKASTTLLCVGRRHCWWGCLYLDAHGEEDRGLQRGRPLLLNHQRLGALHALFASLGAREFLSQNPPPFPHLLLLRARRLDA